MRCRAKQSLSVSAPCGFLSLQRTQPGIGPKRCTQLGENLDGSYTGASVYNTVFIRGGKFVELVLLLFKLLGDLVKRGLSLTKSFKNM